MPDDSVSAAGSTRRDFLKQTGTGVAAGSVLTGGTTERRSWRRPVF